MDNKRTDISQIQKYLNGELDAKAMHRLEREAQGDPFLMDALEGFEGKANQQDNLVDLQRRLGQRITKKESRIVPMWYWAVAASVVVVVGIAALFYQYNAEPQKEGLTARADKTEVKQQPVAPVQASSGDSAIATKPDAIVYDAHKPKPDVTSKPMSMGESNVAEPASGALITAAKPANSPTKDSTDLSDIVMNGLANQKKASLEITDTKVAIDTNKKYQIALNSRAQGVQTNPNYNAPKQPVIVQGVVIGKDDGLPIPGVNIRVLGTTTGTLTNVNGKFSLSGAADKTVSIAALGYKTEQINLRGKDSLKVALSPESNSLNEVVVTSSSQRKVSQNAQPARGWKFFNQYLKDNATPVNGVEGTVKLQFTVEANGSITNIKVTKGLNVASDANAVDLLTNGPTWYGNSNGKPEVVKVKVVYKRK